LVECDTAKKMVTKASEQLEKLKKKSVSDASPEYVAAKEELESVIFFFPKFHNFQKIKIKKYKQIKFRQNKKQVKPKNNIKNLKRKFKLNLKILIKKNFLNSKKL